MGKRKGFSKWTILVMSNVNKPIMSVRLPRLTAYVSALISLVVLLALVFFSVYFYRSTESLKEEQSQLVTTIKDRDSEISSLQEKHDALQQDAFEIQVKMNELQQLEKKMRQFETSINPNSLQQSNEPSGGLEVESFAQLDQLSKQKSSVKLTNGFNLQEKITEIKQQLPEVIGQYETTLSQMKQTKEDLTTFPTLWPTDATRVTSQFGEREDPFSSLSAIHTGIDIAGPWKSPIYAAADGVVIFSGVNGGYGNAIDIRHTSTYETRYAHMESLAVEKGDSVKKGDIIGYMGSTGRSTGVHVHFEILKQGKPVDPYPYITFFDNSENGE